MNKVYCEIGGEMKLTKEEDLKTGDIIFKIRVTEESMCNPFLNAWDRCLIAECEESNSVADKLLMLETIARRKEQYDEKR